MHHAAMANKKEMMFTLARLGCDWRARAEGIDGATAAFVLCGQHTRTTRQQVPCSVLLADNMDISACSNKTLVVNHLTIICLQLL